MVSAQSVTALVCIGARPWLDPLSVGFAEPKSKEEGPDYSRPERNLALELVRVTEAAALAAGRWCGTLLPASQHAQLCPSAMYDVCHGPY
jgi:hypothetical protein